MPKQDVSTEFPYDLRSLPRHRRLSPDAALILAQRAVPFDFVSVSGLDLGNYRVGSFTSVTSNFPPAFVEAYEGEKLYLTDPMVLTGTRGAEIVTEENLDLPLEPRLAYLLRTFHIGHRLAFFLRRGDRTYGSVVFARDAGIFRAEEIEYLALLAAPLHEKITRPLVKRFGAEIVGLLEGEVECLRLAAQGMTSEEIAATSRFRKETVDSYLKSAAKKLGARNRAHAIAEAIRKKLIE
ncbi:helix-turn-helix transcriptional regulator [Rhizobium terrae]|uniref:helix-turn-helix transcriptional regulator n=1 Tax=Rhizobium terrae TaxID=2171756 RepID=UPI000E3DD59B|nr:LuxR C-terminal-related transcriptional regulator [Rhizobium terrae]